MKVALFLLISSNALFQDTSFYDKLLTNFMSNNYYLVINVSNKDFKGKVVTTCQDLYWYLHQKRKINQTEFQSIVKYKMINNDTFDIKVSLNSEFHKIINMPKISKYKFKNRKKFIEQYFEPKNFLCKEDLSPAEQDALIAKLFEWQIPTCLNSYSGYIMIPPRYAKLIE